MKYKVIRFEKYVVILLFRVFQLQTFQGENAATKQERRGKVETFGKQSDSNKECSWTILIPPIKFFMTRMEYGLYFSGLDRM